MGYDNTNRGVLFKNDKKETESHPDYTGKINIDGQDKRLVAWIKTSKDGTKKFMSLSISEFQEKVVTEPKTDVVAEVDDGPINLDDIPF